MRTRTTATLLLATCLAAGCSSQPTYGESVEQCMKAIKGTTPGPVRPKPCEPLTKDDYGRVIVLNVADQNGWTDANGKPDINKMLQSTPSP